MRHESDMIDREYIELLRTEIKRLREYACHKIGCARLKEPAAKCDCGLRELLGEDG